MSNIVSGWRSHALVANNEQARILRRDAKHARRKYGMRVVGASVKLLAQLPSTPKKKRGKS